MATVANSGLWRRPRMARRKSPIDAVMAAWTNQSRAGLSFGHPLHVHVPPLAGDGPAQALEPEDLQPALSRNLRAERVPLIRNGNRRRRAHELASVCRRTAGASNRR